MVHSTTSFRYDIRVSLRRNPVSIQTLVRLTPALLAIALYAITLYGTYVYDDVFVVEQDPRLHQISSWKRLWTTDYFDGGVDNLYRPLVSSSYALEWFIHGDRPWYFHAVNILLHALVCMAVAEFTRRCLSTADVEHAGLSHASLEAARRRRGPWTGESLANITALYAGLLFAAHPIHVEAVANIVGRAELACALAVFGGLIVLAKRPLTYARVCGVILLGIVGLLTKEHGLLQPMLWANFLLLIWPRLRDRVEPERHTQTHFEEPGFAGRNPGSSEYLRTGVGDRKKFGFPIPPREKKVLQILLLAVTWLWAGYLIFREHFLKFEWDRTFLDPTVQPMIKSVGIDRALMPLVLLGHYTRLLFWPIHLSPDYGSGVIGSVVHFGDPYLWIGSLTALILLLVALVLAIRYARNHARSRGTPGEGRGEGESEISNYKFAIQDHPHPDPQRECRERGPERDVAARWARTRFALFCLLSLGVTYAVIGNILTLIGTILAERIAYIPSAFALILLAMLIARLPRKIGVGLMSLILILCCIRTVTWARDWNDPLTLYRESAQNFPRSLQLQILLAQEYHNAAHEPEAQAVMARATEMFPSYWQAWMQRASHALDVGKVDDAERYLKIAQDIEANPRLLVVRQRLSRMIAAKTQAGATTVHESPKPSP